MRKRTGSGVLDVGGRSISYGTSGQPGNPGVVLIHGGAAHRGWWADVATGLAVDHHVAVLDLSGHGDSAHADAYSFDHWADEVLAVADLVSGSGAPVLVGHSLGGMVSLRGASRGTPLGGVVVVDSAVRHYPPEDLHPWLRHVGSPPRILATPEEVLSRFTLFATAPKADPLVINRIGHQAIKRSGAGWTWKFDRRTFGQALLVPEELRPVECQVVIVRGELGDMKPEICETVRTGIGQDAAVHVVEGAGHHVMLDRPAETLALLRRLISELESRRPGLAPPV